MAWSLIASSVDALGPNGGSTTAVDATGADFVGVMAAWYYGITADITVQDSLANTLTPLTAVVDGTEAKGQIWWSKLAVAFPNYQVILAGTSTFLAAGVFLFSGTSASPFDQESGANATQPGALTPGANDALVLCGTAARAGGPYTVTTMDAYVSVAFGVGNNEGVGFGYKIQTTAASINPTWDSTDPATVMGTFLPAVGGQPAMRRWGGTPFVGGQGINSAGGDSGKMWGRRRQSGLVIPRWLADEQERAA